MQYLGWNVKLRCRKIKKLLKKKLQKINATKISRLKLQESLSTKQTGKVDSHTSRQVNKH